MEIKKKNVGNTAVIELTGRLDSNTSRELDQELAELFDKNQKDILIDLSRLEYISSAGLRVLLVGLKKINKKKGRLALCSMNEFVKEIFDIAGFTPLFNIYSSQNEAVETISEETNLA